MKALDHPNTIRLHEVIDDEKGGKLYMILDFAHYGEIMNWNYNKLKFHPCIEGRDHFSEKEI
eukprot:CAMPEP_0202968490 /NCGR_PEP_ID=MMETSP1396-20130829/13815_1 /ASSEMBLY_ACC=CAM_ASM_000872 /TAXON_ID= /ORGANISM="Pseudokeronopsis sp., Strain Brazil" /LENGTH=61 /DNA_ID=CAMNT_0049694867 /DNA_START=19 /DNA_END=204 /DNA_ORIENTATION=+